MNTVKINFLTFFFLSLSANVYTQIDYDSIALELGYLLQENFEYNEEELFDAKFNNEVFLSFITLTDPNGNKAIEKFNKKFGEDNYGNIIFQKLQEAVNEGSDYTFINYTIDDFKNIYIIFRLYNAGGGVNYHQYLFEPSGIKKYRITDIYYFLNGEYISQLLQTQYYETIEKLTDPDEVKSQELKDMIALVRVRRLIENGKIEKANKIYYRDLSEKERAKKQHIFLEMELTDPADTQAYTKLTDKMISYAEEGDPSFYLSAIDHYFMREEYQKVIDAVDSLYTFTGDEFLEIFKASSYMQLNDNEAAEASLLKAIEYYPTMTPSYDMLLYFYESREDIPKLLNTLDTMGKYLSIDIKFLSQTIPNQYPEITQTETYKNWIGDRLTVRKIKVDSMSKILLGSWEFQGTEDFDGNAIETSSFGIEEYGNQRPDFSFSADWNFTATFDAVVYKQGKWDFDLAYETFDFFTLFDKKSAEGKTLIDQGNFQVIEGDYYEPFSYYYHSFDDEYLRLYDRENGLNVYKKLK